MVRVGAEVEAASREEARRAQPRRHFADPPSSHSPTSSTWPRVLLDDGAISTGPKSQEGKSQSVARLEAQSRACEAEETAAWLTRTAKWRTDLHFMEMLPLETVESMLRRGASLEARVVDKEQDRAGPNGQPPGHDVPTALEVAEELRDAGYLMSQVAPKVVRYSCTCASSTSSRR